MLSIYPECYNEIIGHDDYNEFWDDYLDHFESTDIEETL